jgi:hypothetical protein
VEITAYRKRSCFCAKALFFGVTQVVRILSLSPSGLQTGDRVDLKKENIAPSRILFPNAGFKMEGFWKCPPFIFYVFALSLAIACKFA